MFSAGHDACAMNDHSGLEICRLWWNIPFALLGGPKVFLHTVFQLEDTAEVRKLLGQITNLFR